MDSLTDIERDAILLDDSDNVLTENLSPRLAASMPQGMDIRLGSGPRQQTTVAAPISCVGRGLHTGVPIHLTIRPASADHGIAFIRTDLPEASLIPARYDHVVDTRLSTVVGVDSRQRVATVEHLMAALNANGIDNALIEVSGPELPALDGSSAEYDFLLQCAGRVSLAVAKAPVEVLRRVRVEGADGAFAELRPARRGLSLSMTIDFPSAAIGRQSFALALNEIRFRDQLAACRTFVERADIEALQRVGLARGGSLNNAIVVDGEAVLNPGGLRHHDEFVRHKLLDAIGDLGLAGAPLQAEFVGYKSGHGLNNQLLRALFADRANWRVAGTTATSRVRVAA